MTGLEERDWWGGVAIPRRKNPQCSKRKSGAGAKSLRVPTIVKSVNYTSARTCVRARVCVCDGEERPVGIESA